MTWARNIVQFLSSKTVSAGLLGFLLSLFATELLYAVSKRMELEVAGLLFIPIFILMLHVSGFLGERRRRWWQWRRFTNPVRVGILGAYFDDSKEGSMCELQFQPNSSWIEYFVRINSKEKLFDAAEINWTEISSKYAVIVNPFSEIYLEGDKRNFITYEKIKDFIAGGGIFCCTGGFPFYYYWDSTIGKPIDTTPRTRTVEGNMIEDNRYFTDSLVTQDFGAIITADPKKPTLIPSYQKEEDKEFFGNLSNAGFTNIIWEWRSLSKETRGVIPGLRVNHGSDVKFSLAAIPYGKGYLIVAGMALKSDKVEFCKLSEGLVNFTNEIARRHKSKWQRKFENFKTSFNHQKSDENGPENPEDNKVLTVATKNLL